MIYERRSTISANVDDVRGNRRATFVSSTDDVGFADDYGRVTFRVRMKVDPHTFFNKHCYIPKCAEMFVVYEITGINRHKWWRTEKSKMASKMAANFTDSI